MTEKKSLLKSKWLYMASGVLLGALIILTVRFVTYRPQEVHYHANFAIYVNGKREPFKGTQYYQEVAVCSTNDISNPKQRTHMHDNENTVVHVHDNTVTWGQFFENLGWYIGPDFIQTADGTMYKASEDNQLHILLNGQDYTGLTPITNMVINDKSRLLVSYGNEDEAALQKQYNSVPSTAQKFNETKDPASCAGSEKSNLKNRLEQLF